MVALGVITILCLSAMALPPMPSVTKAQSPKVVAQAALAGKAMVVSPVIITATTNHGSVAADFVLTPLGVDLIAGFMYSTTTANGPWKVLGTTNYPLAGGQVAMNYAATNVPRVFFRAFYAFDPYSHYAY